MKPGGKITIPTTVKIIPTCPVPLISGNCFLDKAKAIMNYRTAKMRIKYNKRDAIIPLTFIKPEENPDLTYYGAPPPLTQKKFRLTNLMKSSPTLKARIHLKLMKRMIPKKIRKCSILLN